MCRDELGQGAGLRSGEVLEEKGQEGLRGQALTWEQSHPSRAGPRKLSSGTRQAVLILLLSSSCTQCDGLCGGPFSLSSAVEMQIRRLTSS